MSEETVFSSGDVRVTTRRLVVGYTTYQLSNIASFSIVKVDPAVHEWVPFLTGIGGAMALCTAGAWFLNSLDSLSHTPLELNWILWAGVTVGIVLMLARAGVAAATSSL